MSDNPYTPPTADVNIAREVEIPPNVARKIRNGWIAGVLTTVLTGAYVSVALLGFITTPGVDVWGYGDAALIGALTFGVYKKSRTSAVLLFVVFASEKVAMWIDSGSVIGLPLALVFVWYYWQGIVGTFQYHKLRRTSKRRHGGELAI